MVKIAPASRPSPNTLKKQIVPIVFVPGLMGTRLAFDKPDHVDKSMKWDPDSPLTEMLPWKRLTPSEKRLVLHHRNRATVMDEDADNGWGAIPKSVYGDFRQALLNKKDVAGATSPIYAVGYDWRLSCAVSAWRLAAKVAAILKENKGAQQVVLITHSMGGLVARAAIKLSAGFANSVRGVSHVAQPVAGAVVLYRRVFTGMLTKWDGDKHLAEILGNTPRGFTLTMSGVPGVFELLPTQQYRYVPDDSPESPDDPQIRLLRGPWESGEKGQQDSLGRTVYPHGISRRYLDQNSPPGIFNAKLHGSRDATENQDVQQDINSGVIGASGFHEVVALSMHDNTRMIYSTGSATDVAVKYPVVREQFDDQLVYRKEEGDGTVPDASAMALWPSAVTASVANARVDANRQFVVKSAEHAKILDNSTVRQVLFELTDQMIKKG
jgi:pimeloyl-ACP methyl ester carboxylesterase